MEDKAGLLDTDPVISHAPTDPQSTTLGSLSGSETLVPGRAQPGMTLVLPEPGYLIGDLIGKGGMGEVVAARDLRIGRDVALKRMRAEKPSAEALMRFLREARVQARLDHPAIVPVHELGLDSKGLPFFTMKKLSGATLTQRLLEKLPQNRILRAFVDVCLAIELAHSRGVVHRDLKPSNIMLGDFGEVYVLDWGIARVVGEDVSAPGGGEIDIDTLDEGTQSGAILGTPGYMAPEQIRGTVVTEQADIYSLGAILFEILAGESLHPRGSAAIASTLGNAQQRPSVRAKDRDLPPELDAIAFDCLAELPERRPTAHELAERVEAFLDGDRDLAQRRRMAADLLAEARAAAAPGGAGVARAINRAGRALALDPSNTDAGELAARLVLEPPTTLPPALIEEMAKTDRLQSSDRSKKALFTYLAVFAMLPLVAIADVKSWAFVAEFYGLISLGALATWRSSRSGISSAPVVMVVNLALALLFTRIASPFVITPLAISCFIAAVSPMKVMTDRPRLIFGWTAVAVTLPFILEWIHVLPRSWWIADGVLKIDSSMYTPHGRFEELALVIMSCTFTLVLAWLTVAINRQRREAQDRLAVQAWHLRQFIERE